MLENQMFDSNQKEERAIPGMCNAAPAARDNADTCEGRAVACEGQYNPQNSLTFERHRLNSAGQWGFMGSCGREGSGMAHGTRGAGTWGPVCQFCVRLCLHPRLALSPPLPPTPADLHVCSSWSQTSCLPHAGEDGHQTPPFPCPLWHLSKRRTDCKEGHWPCSPAFFGRGDGVLWLVSRGEAQRDS